jgi:hypothetical protein
MECDTDDQDELATFLSPHSFSLYFSSTSSIFFPYLSLVMHRNVERRGGSIVHAGYGAYTPIPMLVLPLGSQESNVTAMHDETKNSY